MALELGLWPSLATALTFSLRLRAREPTHSAVRGNECADFLSLSCEPLFSGIHFFVAVVVAAFFIYSSSSLCLIKPLGKVATWPFLKLFAINEMDWPFGPFLNVEENSTF